MSKIKEFFIGLRKSTKITLVSCGCFIAMTFVILCFFIMFPITPSDKVLKSWGRESVSKQDTTEAAVTTGPDGETIVGSMGTTGTVTTTTAVSTARTEFTITITTGEGFGNGKIPTGGYPYEDPYYTTPPTTTEPYIPDNPDIPATTENPAENPTEDPDIPPVTEDPVDNPQPTAPPPTEPVEPPTDAPLPPSPPDNGGEPGTGDYGTW